jgi:hypothetical protein
VALIIELIYFNFKWLSFSNMRGIELFFLVLVLRKKAKKAKTEPHRACGRVWRRDRSETVKSRLLGAGFQVDV